MVAIWNGKAEATSSNAPTTPTPSTIPPNDPCWPCCISGLYSAENIARELSKELTGNFNQTKYIVCGIASLPWHALACPALCACIYTLFSDALFALVPAGPWPIWNLCQRRSDRLCCNDWQGKIEISACAELRLRGSEDQVHLREAVPPFSKLVH